MTAHARTPMTFALVASIVAIFAGTAGSGTAARRGCGTVAGAGRTWQVIAVGVACADARRLVLRLAPKVPTTGGANLGTHLSLRCTGVGSATKHAIICAAATGKFVYGLAK